MAETEIETPLATQNPPEPEQPEFAAIPPAQPNEPSAKNPPAPKIGLGEKIRRATATAFSAAGFRKGKGRPKKCRACNGLRCEECHWTGLEPGKADVPSSLADDAGSGDAVPVASPDSPVPVVDSLRASLFRRSVVSAARSVLKILNSIVRVYCDAAELDAKFCDRAISKCEPSAEALERWTESLDVVLKKHNVEPKHAEEISLIVNSAELLAPYGILLAELKGEIRRRRLTENTAAK